MIDDLHAYAKTFPNQGGVEIGPWLEKYASEVPQGSVIVEIGCWLGAGTAYLALGAMKSGAVIHTFDRWKATAQEVEKAAKFGVKLEEGEDTLSRVISSLRPFWPNSLQGAFWSKNPNYGGSYLFKSDSNTDITCAFHCVSLKQLAIAPEILKGPIGLYVDDATKVAPLWEHAMRVFKPHFIPGKTILALMDYHFDLVVREQGKTNWQNYSAQRNYMAKHASEFELVEDRIGGTTAAVWRFRG